VKTPDNPSDDRHGGTLPEEIESPGAEFVRKLTFFRAADTGIVFFYGACSSWHHFFIQV